MDAKDTTKELVVVEEESDESLLPAELPNKEILKQESAELLARLVREKDPVRKKDLKYLFDENNDKKRMLRQDTLNDVQDAVVDILATRLKEHPDEFDNDTLLKTATTVQTIMDKNVAPPQAEQKPMIDINKTEININTQDVSADIVGLNRQQRKNIENFLKAVKLPGGILSNDAIDVVVDEIVEVKDDDDEK